MSQTASWGVKVSHRSSEIEDSPTQPARDGEYGAGVDRVLQGVGDCTVLPMGVQIGPIIKPSGRPRCRRQPAGEPRCHTSPARRMTPSSPTWFADRADQDQGAVRV